MGGRRAGRAEVGAVERGKLRGLRAGLLRGLPELTRWAALLRIQLGADGPDASIALARAWSGPQSLPARTLASDYLARQGRWTEVAELAEAAEGSDRALLDHVRLLRARALIELSRREEAVAVIPRDARSEIARDLAMEAVAGRPLDAASIELLTALWPDPTDAFARVAERALFAGALDAARSAAASIPRSVARSRMVARSGINPTNQNSAEMVA